MDGAWAADYFTEVAPEKGKKWRQENPNGGGLSRLTCLKAGRPRCDATRKDCPTWMASLVWRERVRFWRYTAIRTRSRHDEKHCAPYRADGVEGPQEMERNEAAARHSWARQHAWLLLTFFPFPVGHPPHPPCRSEVCVLLESSWYSIYYRVRPSGWGHRMAYRKWKETKQQPSMLPGPGPFPVGHSVAPHGKCCRTSNSN